MLEKSAELDKKIQAEKDAIDANRDGWADKSHSEALREQGSLLDDKDDFWSKADKYADGDYSMGKAQIIKNTTPESDDKLDLDPLKGFEDGDGDGNEIIDDAIIVE